MYQRRAGRIWGDGERRKRGEEKGRDRIVGRMSAGRETEGALKHTAGDTKEIQERKCVVEDNMEYKRGERTILKVKLEERKKI